MLIILDRDGVINEDSDEYIKSPIEWVPIPGSLEAIAKLNHINHTVVIASNQSGIARGLFNEQILNEIHHKMRNELAKFGGHIDNIFYCPHGPEDNCKCRKPKPGLFQQISQKFNSNLQEDAIAIGDALRDLQAAHAVGCKAILVKTGKGAQLDVSQLPTMIPIADNLSAAVDKLIKVNFNYNLLI